MSDYDEAWRCGGCGKWHDDDLDARDCCRPTITEGWKCRQCGAYFSEDGEPCRCGEDEAQEVPAVFLAAPTTPQEAVANLKLF